MLISLKMLFLNIFHLFYNKGQINISRICIYISIKRQKKKLQKKKKNVYIYKM